MLALEGSQNPAWTEDLELAFLTQLPSGFQGKILGFGNPGSRAAHPHFTEQDS